MATSSGNSSGSSEGEIQGARVDQRKRKRMESNRESARRSRMKKQNHLNQVMSNLTQLRKDNNQILTTINVTTQHFLALDAENSVLRAQMVELTHRLESLNGIITYINNGSPDNDFFERDDYNFGRPVDGFMNPLNNNTMSYVNQPILASPDLFHY